MNKNRSNKYIVGKISVTYNILGMIRKLIKNSIYEHKDKDLEQYIYEVLLRMDNERLNYLYDNDQLNKFITQIIKNQRNSGKFYKHLSLDFDELDGMDVEDISEHDFRYDFIMDKIEESKIEFFHTGLTQMELRNIASLSVVELYYIKKMEKYRICITLNSGMSTVNLMLSDGKRYLRDCWNREKELYKEKQMEKYDTNGYIDDSGE